MIKPSGSLRMTSERELSCSPAELIAHIQPQVEPLLQRYPFISKLSGGGVVIRVLKTPPTTRPLWGRFFGQSFHLTRIPQGEDLSPWAPIMHGNILPIDGGCRVDLELKPHPSARTLAGLYGFFGVLLLIASSIGIQAQPVMALIGLLFGILLLFFPGYRARQSFREGCALALETLDRVMAIEAHSEDASAAISSGSDHRA
jgi:hypothetical protein